MLKNNNLKVCFKLVLRDFRLHKFKNLLLLLGVVMVTALYTFVFLIGNSVEGAYLLSYQYSYGSTSHILYKGLTSHQADTIARHAYVKNAVRLNTLGWLSSDMIGYRNVMLSVTDWNYADSVLSLPTAGRLPETADEIALDEFTLDSLGIPHEIGQNFSLEWTSPDGSAHISSFTLCGWWSSPTNFSEACAWISADGANRLFPSYNDASASNVTLGVMLHQPRNLDMQAQQILSDLGIFGGTFTTNLAYNDLKKEAAGQQATPLYMIALLVVICGFLMIYSILHVAVEQEIHFYAGLKTLGMTPRQLRWMPLYQAAVLCLFGLIPGWLLGFGIHLIITPRFVVGMEHNPAIYFLAWWPFLLAALLNFATTLTACILPTLRISRMTPSQTLRFMNTKPVKSRKKGKQSDVALKRTTLPVLAFRTLCRNKGQMLLSLLSLLLALLLLCASWIRYVSYDMDIYLAAFSPWDYTIMDGSTYFSLQRYNPNTQALTDETVRELLIRPEVQSIGVLKTHELPLTGSAELLDIALRFYNETDANGMSRRDSMAGDPAWCDGLDHFLATGEYTGLIVGVDGPFLDFVVNNYPLIDGSFDPKTFADGGYVLMAGAASTSLSCLPAGSVVEILGRKFNVMAAVNGDDSFINGSNSPEAAFNFIYYVPLTVFNEMLPGQGIRQLAVNIDATQQKSFEKYLDEYEQGLNRGVAVIRRSEYESNFMLSRFNTELTPLVIGTVLMMIGFLNFTNMLITKTLSRKREFAVYESLGMTHKQLKKLLLLEGLLHAALLAAVLIPVTFLVTWYGMPLLMARMNTWCLTYRFTLFPLWLTLPLLLSAAAAVQLGCLSLVCQSALNDRLRAIDGSEYAC